MPIDMEANPLGILAIDHLEFTCKSLNGKEKELFYTLGFEKTYKDQETNSELFSQDQVHFLLTANKDKNSPSAKFLELHGEGISKISFLVDSCEDSIREARKTGVYVLQELSMEEDENGVYLSAQIEGAGDVRHEFIERPDSFFRPGFKKIKNDPNATPLKEDALSISHIASNVLKGDQDKWINFYKNTFGFTQVDQENADKNPKPLQLLDGAITLLIDDKDNMTNIQRVTISSSNIKNTINNLKKRDVKFVEASQVYHTEKLIGSLSFEYIQRRN